MSHNIIISTFYFSIFTFLFSIVLILMIVIAFDIKLKAPAFQLVLNISYKLKYLHNLL